VGPHGIETIFYLAYLVDGYGRASIALNTTDAFAASQVATEQLGENVGREEHIADLQDGGDCLVVHLSSCLF
jgi:hypothetical protein